MIKHLDALTFYTENKKKLVHQLQIQQI